MKTCRFSAIACVSMLMLSTEAQAVNFNVIVRYNPFVFVGHVESATARPKAPDHYRVDNLGTYDKDGYATDADITITDVLSATAGSPGRMSRIHRCTDQTLVPGQSYLFFSSEKTYNGARCIFVAGFQLRHDLGRPGREVVLLTKDTYLEFPTSIPLHQQKWSYPDMTVDGVHKDRTVVLTYTYAYLDDFMHLVEKYQGRRQ